MKAQQPVSVHLTEKDGLPDKEFYNILEDSKGFIWLCADKGLFRYDGKTFENYSNQDKRGLSVFEPLEDHLGRIWCINISGQFFYVENNKLVTFIDLGKELNGELSSFVVTKKNLIVFSRFKIYTVNLLTKKIITKFKTNFAYGLPFRYKDKVLFGGLNYLSNINRDGKKEDLIKLELPKTNATGGFNINQKSNIFQLGSSLFLKQESAEKNSFFKLDLEKKTNTKIHNLKELIHKRYLVFFDNDNELWVATNTGVYVYSYDNHVFKLEKQFLEDYQVTRILKDKDNNFWFTTLTNGVFVMPNIFIEHLNISKENSNISCLDKIDDTTLFFGTNKGDVGFYNTDNHSEEIIDLSSANRVSAIKYHPKNKVSFISKDGGGFLLNNKTKQTEVIENFYTVKSFSIVENEDLLFANYSSVRLLKRNSLSGKGKSISANKRAYSSFYSLINKIAYVGFVDDLVAYDSQWIPEKIRYNDQPIFAVSLTETSNGIVWVGTFKDGIFGIENNKIVAHFTTAHNLISNRIEKIKADQNKLWIATDNGIQLLDVDTMDIKTLTKRDGVISYDISGIEILGNRVFFSSNIGMFSIDKVKAFKAPIEHNVYFKHVEINEKVVDLKSNYKLDYDQNAIKIEFNVNGFQFNQKGKYAYRLLGLNTDWFITETGINSVKYNSLPAGNYTFQVKPVLGVDSEENVIEELKFSIKRPFWKTWWFISSFSILVLGSTVLYYRRKIRKEERQREIEVKQLFLDKQLIALKLENLRSQMNPHFIFNALNSIQEYIVLNKKKLASEYLGKFADLIRTYLNHSTKGAITLQEEIDCLEMYLELEKLRFEDKLQYNILTSGDLCPKEVNIPTMFVQPYVENALKHGLLHRKTDRVLTINFFIDETANVVKCTIVDNGVGRVRAEAFKARSRKTHQSFATKATSDRLELLNYGKQKQIGVTITDLMDGEHATGTQVEIIIPYTTH